MRQGTIITDSLSVRAEPGGKILGSLHRNERVNIRKGPIIRDRTWWQVESLDGSTHLTGWVAEGDGRAVWLSMDAVEETPPPKPLPSLDDPDEAIPWKVWVMAGGVVASGLALLYFTF